MGYRSDVAYTIRFKQPEHMALFITEAKSKDYGKGALDECVINEDKLAIYFFADGVKWYDSYEDVQMHEKLLQQARDWCDGDDHEDAKEGGSGQNIYKLGWIFTRVGEDTDDNVEDCGGDYDWDWICISRQIIRDWD